MISPISRQRDQVLSTAQVVLKTQRRSVFGLFLVSQMRGRSLSVSEARRKFLELIRGFAETSDRWIITKNGKPEAILLSNEDYRRLIETIDILGDPSLVNELKKREKEIKEGEVKTNTHHEVCEHTN